MESEAVGKADSVLRRAEGPRGVVFVAQEYQAIEVSFHKASLLHAFTRESTSRWHCISPHPYGIVFHGLTGQ